MNIRMNILKDLRLLTATDPLEKDTIPCPPPSDMEEFDLLFFLEGDLDDPTD